LDVSLRNWLVFPYPLFDASARENPLEFLDVTYHVKTIGPDWTTVWRKISQSHLQLFLADRNGRAIATLLRLSSVV